MNDANHDPSMDAVTAVELSAADLIELSGIPEGATSRTHGEVVGGSLSAEQASALAIAPRVLSPMRQRLPGVALGILGVGIVASIAMGAHYAGVHYQSGASKPALPTPTIAWTPIPERAEYVEVLEEPPAPPTLFVNPFDKTEVFELPPNISQEEARQIVAEVLMERARQRARR